MDVSAPPKVHKSIPTFHFRPVNCLTECFQVGSPVLLVLQYLIHLILKCIFSVHMHVYDDIPGVYDTA